MRNVFRPALEALRLYWPAFLAVQAVAVALLIAHRLSADVRAFCESLAAWKAGGGIFLAAGLNVATGGVLPELAKAWFRPAHLPKPTAGDLVHQFTMFAVLGAAVDIFYRGQTLLWGSEANLGTLIAKILTDQLLFTPFIALPFIVLWFMWREHDYRVAEMMRALNLRTFATREIQIFASNLAFWIPVLFCVYSLPPALQFMLYLLMNTAWCLLLIFIARRQVGET